MLQPTFKTAAMMLASVLMGVTLSACSARVSPGQGMAPVSPQAPKPPAASELLEAKPQWFACQTQAQCQVTEGPCGEPQAVSGASVQEFQAYRNQMNQMIDCHSGKRPLEARTPRCLSNRCALSPLKK